jgi:predicted lipoprotein with Yx(FWY)xxD motif
VAEATLPPSPTTSIAPPDVAIATSSLGSILVDGEGLTLYVFSNDAPGSSSCIDSCALSWPPLAASTVAVGDDLDPADFSLITRPDGTSQLAVGQRPLYRFAGDIAPGETSGQGLNGLWFVVAPDGTPIEAS